VTRAGPGADATVPPGPARATATAPVGTVLEARLVPGDPQFEANREAMGAMVAELAALHEQVLEGGGERYVARHLARGKLLARQRLEALVDPATPVLELSPLAGLETGDPLGGGMVVALAEVSGTQCLVIANDPTVRGGTTSPTTIRKLLRAMDVARDNRLPVVLLVESGGADLPNQAEVFVPGGEQFRRLTQLSAAGIPTVCVVFGSSTAGGAYLPAMSDSTIFVEGAARVFLGGPPLVKMAVGEDADEEELGGAAMHARVSGLCDYLARDEHEALRQGRRVVAHLHWRRLGPPPVMEPQPPGRHPDELLGVAPADVRVPVDVREVLARLLDGSRFEELKPDYGPQLVCGWGTLAGYPVGVVANNGILFSEEARKGAQLVQLCNRVDTPILFLQNITGFMVGTRYEQGGIIKDGAKMINAVSNSTVPHLTLMIGASYGAGNYAMAGRAYAPRFVFTWPNHRIAVMGPAQLAGVLSIVRRNAAAAAGQPFDEAADAELRAATEAQIERESTAAYATGHLWDDGVVDPRETRTVLSVALAAAHSAPVEGTARFGVVRH
jgi:acetyl-CoA carboxylase carboxyltransferase component